VEAQAPLVCTLHEFRSAPGGGWAPMPAANQVKFTVPDGVTPGTLLQVPVRGGAELIKVRVPSGLGAGSTLILTQTEGTDQWEMEVGSAVHAAPSDDIVLYDKSPGQQPPSPSVSAHGGYQPVEVPQPMDSVVAFTVRLDTTVGSIDIIVRPDWAPLGTRRFLELAQSGDLSDLAFYRAIKGCIVQFGLPAKRTWPCIQDDPQTGVPFLLGAVSFAAIGEHTRRSTLFICIGDMSHMLGQKSWETPIGAVAESSLDVLERINTTYGDISEFGGSGPDTSRINNEGNRYLAGSFPELTYIRSAWQVDDPHSQAPQQAPQQQLSLAAQADREAAEAERQAAEAARSARDAEHAEYVAQAREAAELAQACAQEARAAADRAMAAERLQQAQSIQVQSSKGATPSQGSVQPVQPVLTAPQQQPPQHNYAAQQQQPHAVHHNGHVIPASAPQPVPKEVPLQQCGGAQLGASSVALWGGGHQAGAVAPGGIPHTPHSHAAPQASYGMPPQAGTQSATGSAQTILPPSAPAQQHPVNPGPGAHHPGMPHTAPCGGPPPQMMGGGLPFPGSPMGAAQHSPLQHQQQPQLQHHVGNMPGMPGAAGLPQSCLPAGGMPPQPIGGGSVQFSSSAPGMFGMGHPGANFPPVQQPPFAGAMGFR